MRLLSPAGLALLVTIPAIAALYLLKPKRENRPVASTWLWEKTLSELRADAPFQRLRSNLLLILQVLAAALIAFAAARPARTSGPREGATIGLVLDGGAGMCARSSGGTRFERARALLLDHLTAAAPGDRAALVLARRRPVVLCPLTDDLGAVERALREAEPSDEDSDPAAAERLAAAIVSGGASPRVISATDDPAAAAAAGLKPEELTVHSVFEEAENAGIVALEARRLERRTEVFTVVANFGAAPRTTRLEIDLDGAAVDARTLDIAPGGRRAVTASLPAAARGIVHARLSGSDALSSDDEAWIALSEERLIRILLVSDGNVFLEKAWTLEPRVVLDVLPPGRYGSRSSDGYDVVAFDRWAPAELPDANLLIFGVLPAGLGFQPRSVSTEPVRVGVQDENHPVLAQADVRGMVLSRAIGSPLPPSMTPLAEADGAPVLAASEKAGRRVVIVGFSLLDSDWPLRVSFPIFLANATVWLAPPRGDPFPVLRPGEPIPLGEGRRGAAERIEVAGPRGFSTVLEPGDGWFAETSRVGVYRVRGRSFERAAPVSLLSERASRLGMSGPGSAPVPRTLARRVLPGGGRDLWRYAAALCVALLLAEWIVYLRRSAPA